MMTTRKKITYKPTETKTFIKALSKLPATLKIFLSDYSAEDYTEMGATCYLSSDGQSGYAITKEFDLISVFSLPGAHQGEAAVLSAINSGAQTLDCLGEFLVELYSRFGFVEVNRVAWDDRYAPEGWDYEKLGRPAVVYMKRI